MLYFDQNIIPKAFDKNHQVQLIYNKVNERVTKYGDLVTRPTKPVVNFL